MKLLKNLILFFVSICLIGACKKDDTDPAIQAELDKVKGKWKIDSLNFTNVDESSRKVFSGGSVFFDVATFHSKQTSSETIHQSGDIQIGEVFFRMGYAYDFNKKIFKNFSLGTTQAYIENQLKYEKEAVIIDKLWLGNWDIIVIGDKLAAKQITNTRTPDARLGFRATRQN